MWGTQEPGALKHPAVLLYLRGAQRGCCPELRQCCSKFAGTDSPALWRPLFRGAGVKDTEDDSAAVGIAEESEAQTTEQEVSGTAIEGATRLSEEEIRILTKFVTEVPKSEVENTAQAKRLAKQRKQIGRAHV